MFIHVRKSRELSEEIMEQMEYRFKKKKYSYKKMRLNLAHKQM